MKINSFDINIQSDEFATEYEEYLALLEEQWEEPEEWVDCPNPII